MLAFTSLVLLIALATRSETVTWIGFMLVLLTAALLAFSPVLCEGSFACWVAELFGFDRAGLGIDHLWLTAPGTLGSATSALGLLALLIGSTIASLGLLRRSVGYPADGSD